MEYHDREQKRFTYKQSTWDKFPDGTDHIILGGYTPVNEVRLLYNLWKPCR